MNSPISQHTEEHDDIALLLPWYVNQSLDADEQERVRAHLRDCLICRRELQNLTAVQSSLQQDANALDFSARASFRNLQERLAQPARPSAVTPFRAEPPRRLRPSRPLVALALAASVLILVAPIAIQRLAPPATTEFETLSNRSPQGSANAGQLRVVFAPELPNRQMENLLRSIGGQLVSGPNTSGAYTIRLEGQNAGSVDAISFLRRQEGVVLAEPVMHADAGPRP
jgi:hypothetical protein